MIAFLRVNTWTHTQTASMSYLRQCPADFELKQSPCQTLWILGCQLADALVG